MMFHMKHKGGINNMTITLEEMREKHNSIIETCKAIDGFDITPLMTAFSEIEQDYEGTITSLSEHTSTIETLKGDLSKAKDEIYNMFMTRGVDKKKEVSPNNEPQNNENHQSLDDYIKNFEG